MNNSAPRILVVEDEEAIRLAIVTWLRDEGFEVLETTGAEEALALLEDPDHINVLFTDVRMPGPLDGVDLAVRAKKDDPSLPVLVTSGFASKLSERLSKIDPPANFVSKPYSVPGVVATLKALASHH